MKVHRRGESPWDWEKSPLLDACAAVFSEEHSDDPLGCFFGRDFRKCLRGGEDNPAIPAHGYIEQGKNRISIVKCVLGYHHHLRMGMAEGFPGQLYTLCEIKPIFRTIFGVRKLG